MPSPLDPYFELLDATVLTAGGEPCTYMPKGGEASTVSAVVNESSRIEERQSGLMLIASLDVLVSRDDIGEPQVGDQFKREGDSRVFSYVGLLSEKGPGGHVLRYEREQPYQIGGNRRP